MVILIYGLSGAGKTTLGREIKAKRMDAILLDGDKIRETVNSDLGMSIEDRKENVRRIANIAKVLNEQRKLVIITIICPTEEMRLMVKDIIGNDLRIIYLSTPLKVCRERDVKGLYAKLGDEMSGVGSVFEESEDYDLKINTAEMSIEECAQEIDKKFSLFRLPEGFRAMKKYNCYSGTRRRWKINYLHKFAYIQIAKCASTQMGRWTGEDNATYLRETASIPEKIRDIKVSEVDSVEKVPDGFVKFAVYRDPIARFYSACHFPGYDAKRAIKEFEEWTTDDGVCKDPHMRRQSDFYNIDDVDYIVDLKDLDDFLAIEFNYNLIEKSVVTQPFFEDVDLTLSDDEMEYLKDYYKKDWEIAKSDKMWKNPKLQCNK